MIANALHDSVQHDICTILYYYVMLLRRDERNTIMNVERGRQTTRMAT